VPSEEYESEFGAKQQAPEGRWQKLEFGSASPRKTLDYDSPKQLFDATVEMDPHVRYKLWLHGTPEQRKALEDGLVQNLLRSQPRSPLQPGSQRSSTPSPTRADESQAQSEADDIMQDEAVEDNDIDDEAVEECFALACKEHKAGRVSNAIEGYLTAASYGHAGAECNLGLCYQYGTGVPSCAREAELWYTK
jgi:TPR repeat protein